MPGVRTRNSTNRVSRDPGAVQTTSSTASHNYPFELWKYDDGGKPLFVNRFSDRGFGQRFLFVDRTGAGHYSLESSNVLQGEE